MLQSLQWPDWPPSHVYGQLPHSLPAEVKHHIEGATPTSPLLPREPGGGTIAGIVTTTTLHPCNHLAKGSQPGCSGKTGPPRPPHVSESHNSRLVTTGLSNCCHHKGGSEQLPTGHALGPPLVYNVSSELANTIIVAQSTDRDAATNRNMWGLGSSLNNGVGHNSVCMPTWLKHKPQYMWQIWPQQQHPL